MDTEESALQDVEATLNTWTKVVKKLNLANQKITDIRDDDDRNDNDRDVDDDEDGKNLSLRSSRCGASVGRTEVSCANDSDLSLGGTNNRCNIPQAAALPHRNEHKPSPVWFKPLNGKSKPSFDDALFVEKWKQALSAPKANASSVVEGMANAGHLALREASDYNIFCSALKDKLQSHSLFVRVLINELTRFLALKVFAQGLPHPSPDVESAWSVLMLFPQTYSEICKAMGSPEAIPFHTKSVLNLSKNAKEERYSLTLSSYSALFNEEPPSDIWPSNLDKTVNESSKMSSRALRWKKKRPNIPLRKMPRPNRNSAIIQDDEDDCSSDGSADDSSSDGSASTSTLEQDGVLTDDTENYIISLPMFSLKLSADRKTMTSLGNTVDASRKKMIELGWMAEEWVTDPKPAYATALSASVGMYNNSVESLAKSIKNLKVSKEDNKQALNEEQEGIEISLEANIGDTNTMAEF